MGEKARRREARTDRVLARLKEELSGRMPSPEVPEDPVAGEGGAPASEHVQKIDRLRKMRLAEERKEQDLQRLQQWSADFDKLDPRRRGMLEDAFCWACAGDGEQEDSRLMQCLDLLGLSGLDHAERLSVGRICEKAATGAKRRASAFGSELVGLEEFAAELVPRVVRQLNKLRGVSLSDTLTELGMNREGRLRQEEVLDVVREIWQFDLGADVDDAGFQELMGQLSAAAGDFAAGDLGHLQFLRNICDVAEEVRLLNHLARARVRERRRIVPAAIAGFSHDLVAFERLFCSVSKAQGSGLDASGCGRLLRKLGLTPPLEHSQRAQFQALLRRADNGVHFEEFLQLVAKARSMLESRMREELYQVHAKLSDQEDSPLTPEGLLHALFEAAGISPQCALERRAVGRVLRLVGADGSGRLPFIEAARACCHAQEMLYRAKMEREREFAVTHGISEQELNQARWAFDKLDADESGSLDYMEVYEAMKLLGVRTGSLDEVKATVSMIDIDRSGCVELTEFMHLVKLVQEQRGHQSLEDSLLRPTASTGRRQSSSQVHSNPEREKASPEEQ